jgi:hypothetical protein
MAEILIGKFVRRIFRNESGSYQILDLRISGGRHVRAVFDGVAAPEPRKTVEFTVFGEYVRHPQYGRNLMVTRFERYAGISQDHKQQAATDRAVQKIIGGPTDQPAA